MALIGLTFKREYTINSVLLDAVISELHSASSVVTSVPIEDGADINDHIALDPINVQIQGFISDSPLDFDLASFDRVQNAFDELFRLWKNKELVTVVTGFKIYENMAITRLDVPRDNSTFNSLKFSIDLTEITKLPLQNVSINTDKFQAGSTRNENYPVQDLGKMQALNIPSATENNVNSLIRRINNNVTTSTRVFAGL